MSGRSPMLPVTKTRWLSLKFNITTTTTIIITTGGIITTTTGGIIITGTGIIITIIIIATPRLLTGFAKPRAADGSSAGARGGLGNLHLG